MRDTLRSNTQTFRETSPAEFSRSLMRESIRGVVRSSIIYLIIFSTLIWLSSYFGQQAVAAKNSYTMAHVEYNQKVLFFLVAYSAYMVFLYASQRNFGVRFGCNCIDFSLWLVLSLARFTALCAYPYFILPLVFETLVDTWTMSKRNWWKSADEPFFTNSSPFNAFLSWLFWF